MSTTRITTILGILSACLVTVSQGEYFSKETNKTIGTAASVVTAVAFYYTQGRKKNGQA